MCSEPEQVIDLKGLFDLFGKGFYAPSASIQIADTRGSLNEVVSQENNDGPFAVDIDPGFDSAQAPRISPSVFAIDQTDFVFVDDITFGSFHAFTAGTIAKVVLAPSTPEDSTSGQIEELCNVNIGFVEDRDLFDLKTGELLHGAAAPLIASSFVPWWRRLSHTFLSSIAWVNCVNRRLTMWLHGVKVRDSLSTHACGQVFSSDETV